MMDPKDWSIDANEAVEICIYAPGTGKELHSDIHPSYTYPIFGENETIFGYKDLKLRLMFAADDMDVCVEVTYAEKVKKIGDVEAEDIVEVLKDHLPNEAFEQNPPTFLKTLKGRTEAYVPPGNLTSTYSISGRTYSVYCSKISDPACAALLARVQPLVLFYIEGSSSLDLEDEPWTTSRWTVFFLYDTTPSSSHPTFMGYCTLYDHYLFSASEPDLTRTRLSQFLILPPFQKRGHGMRFYSAIIDYYLAQPHVRELTVEDPNEEFTDLRDIADVVRLRADPDIAAGKLTLAAVVGKKFPWEDVRKRQKMPKRQFARCIEIMLLKSLSKRNANDYKSYRLVVKGRLYRHNKDVLVDVEKEERLERLDETYIGVEEDYQRLLKAIKTRQISNENGAHQEKGKGKGRSEEVVDTGEARAKKRIKIISGESETAETNL